MKSTTVPCDGVPYRQGWIEISSNIHPGCVNLEAWGIVPKFDSPLPENVTAVSDLDVTGNVELELTIAQARRLMSALQDAIEAALRAAT